jgi:hypothetical protein
VIHYEVTLEYSPSTASALERWMRNAHIPDMLATGCFSAIHFARADGRFRTVYAAATRQLLDRYLFAGICSPVFGERSVVALIELARGVVGNVEKRDIRRCGERQRKSKRRNKDHKR